MVLDKLSNYKQYLALSKNMEAAFQFLINTDLVHITSGKHHVNESVFALVQEYETKEKEDCKLEGHTKYIDIQYVIRGVEQMGVAPKNGQKIIETNDQNDYSFYEGGADFFRVEEGMFTIFFPNDLHMPCIKMDGVSTVKKVVMKVKI